MKLANTVGKMVPIDLLEAGIATNLHCVNYAILQNANKVYLYGCLIYLKYKNLGIKEYKCTSCRKHALQNLI